MIILLKLSVDKNFSFLSLFKIILQFDVKKQNVTVQ